ncbi:MAG: M23 family metallopeptidase [Microbacteriaceae bacterium]
MKPQMQRQLAFGALAACLLAYVAINANASQALANPNFRVPPLSDSARGFQIRAPLWNAPIAPPIIDAVFRQPESKWGAGHRGIDLIGVPDTPILAPTSGVVKFSGQVFGRPVVTLAAANGLTLEFEPACLTPPALSTTNPELALASQVFSVIGQPVLAGQPFAWFCPEGQLTHCLIPCLHWGVKTAQGGYLSPQRFTGELKSAKPKPRNNL